MGEPRPVREGRERAEGERHRHKLGVAPIRDLFGFIERSYPELLLARRPMPDGPAGAMLRDGDRWVLVVNTHGQILARQRFTAAHELAHFLFEGETEVIHVDRPEAMIDNRSPLETRANAFAVHLILPAEVLLTRVQEGLDLDDEEQIVALSMEYGISVKSLAFHLLNVCGMRNAPQRLRHIRPLRVASSMGLSDRVEREQNAIGVTRWPRQYMSMADMAYHAGKLDVEELSRLFGDNQLVDQVVRTDLDDEFS